MNESDLLHQLAQGEDSRHQFKRDVTNTDALAAELAAFANSGGGTLFIGIDDDGLGGGAGCRRRAAAEPVAGQCCFPACAATRASAYGKRADHPRHRDGSGSARWTVQALSGSPRAAVDQAGLGPEAEWERATDHVIPPVATLLELLASTGELGNADIRERLKLKNRTHVRERYIDPALAQGLIEMTIPAKPRSRLQKYRLTATGRTLLQSLHKEPPTP